MAQKRRTELWKRGRLGQRQAEIGEYMPKKIVKKTYGQNWSNYNQAQMEEFPLFQDILIELIDSLLVVPSQKGKNGRPFADIKEMLFCCVTKLYFGKSARRNIGYLSLAKEKKYIQHVPHFNTILNYYRKPILTPLLKHLIEHSGLPVKEFERQFAVDSSGFSTCLYGRWFSARTASNEERRLYKKAHVMSGVKTGIVSSVNVTEGYWHDSPQLGHLARVTAENFYMGEVSADAGYLARDNFDLISSLGAVPYIKFKKNSIGKPLGSMVYKQMWKMWEHHRDVFLEHYHKRSNAESVFSAIKRKFGLHLYNQTETGQINELLCMILAYNITILIHEMFESQAVLEYKDGKKLLVRVS